MRSPRRYASRGENGTEYGVLESTGRQVGGDALRPPDHDIRIIRTKPLQPARNKESEAPSRGCNPHCPHFSPKSRPPEFVDRSFNEL
jgi:hypothetical protein